MELNEFDDKLRKQYAYKNNCSHKHINKELFINWLLKRVFEKEVESTYSLKESQIYEMLDEIINWYHKFGTNSTPDELLDQKDKIVTCMYWISQNLSNTEKKYNAKMQWNKLEVDRIIHESKQDTPTKARAKAKQGKRTELMQEAQYKSEVQKLERLLSSLDKIVYAMQQRIAWLRDEFNKNPQI